LLFILADSTYYIKRHKLRFKIKREKKDRHYSGEETSREETTLAGSPIVVQIIRECTISEALAEI